MTVLFALSFPQAMGPQEVSARGSHVCVARVSAEKAVEPCEAARACTQKSSLVSGDWSMSALPPEADIRQRIEHVCFCQKRTSVLPRLGRLLNTPGAKQLLSLAD
jgi:hypothetical protein